ncbi:pilus assembly protein TadG-related protein [Jeotgalibacillus malaysiensis]|uniref:pilus assembly protein TadG-related protein n=1 Tax=Jeotgalibacillus malaysiensis TaxID=1508404 RepID=UPI0038507802
MKYLKEERGNITIFILGLMVILIALIMLVLNFSNALIAKEQANSAAQQASLAATAVLYERLDEAIEEYESEVVGIVDSYPKSIEEKVEERTSELSSGEMSGYSLNEIQNKALDQVMAEELSKGLGDDLLREKIEEEMEFSWSLDMREAAKNAILANGGTLDEAEITFFSDGQIVVSAAHDVEVTQYNDWFSGINENIKRQSAGPELAFVKELEGFDNRNFSLQ